VDCNAARSRIADDKREGGQFVDRVMKMKKVTAATLITDARSHDLGKSVLDRAQLAFDQHQKKERAAKVKAELLYKKQCNEADKVVQAKGMNPSSWTVGEIRKMIRPIKLKSDLPLPKGAKKEQFLIYYTTMMNRQRRAVDEELLRDTLMVGSEVEVNAGVDGEEEVMMTSTNESQPELALGEFHDL
jgi:hypothetical protein